MNTRPDKKKYRNLVSATIIMIFACALFVSGVLAIVFSIVRGQMLFGIPSIFVGFACVIPSAFLFIIANIAEDLHWQSYLKEYYGEEAVRYHTLSLQRLQLIEERLQQISYPPDGQDRMPMTGEMQQYNFQPDPESRYRRRESGQRMENRAYDSSEDSSFDYKTQYKRPTTRR